MKWILKLGYSCNNYLYLHDSDAGNCHLVAPCTVPVVRAEESLRLCAFVLGFVYVTALLFTGQGPSLIWYLTAVQRSGWRFKGKQREGRAENSARNMGDAQAFHWIAQEDRKFQIESVKYVAWISSKYFVCMHWEWIWLRLLRKDFFFTNTSFSISIYTFIEYVLMGRLSASAHAGHTYSDTWCNSIVH